MNNLFVFENNQSIRTVLLNGVVWFSAMDVCRVLGVINPSKTVSRLDEDEHGITTSYTTQGAREMLIVNESGLYALIMTSRKPVAKKFRKWVTNEVVPAIRKTGSYLDVQQVAAQTLSLPGKDAWSAIQQIVKVNEIWDKRLFLSRRQKMIKKFRNKGLTDEQAVARVDRMLFVDQGDTHV